MQEPTWFSCILNRPNSDGWAYVEVKAEDEAHARRVLDLLINSMVQVEHMQEIGANPIGTRRVP